MKFFDSHCHLQDKRIIKDIGTTIEKWHSIGGKYLVCCGTNENDWKDVLKISEKYDFVIPCFGIHPWFITKASDKWQTSLELYLNRVKSGIGEIGLDFTLKKSNPLLQEKIFKTQLELAKEKELPVSIHIRKAWDPFIHILKHMGEVPAGGLIHSYSGSADMIPLFEKYGLYISFSGSITNQNNRKVRQALQKVSLNRVLIETDSPDIIPKIPRLANSKINKPENLFFIAKSGAEITGLSINKFTQNTYNNGKRLFNTILT
ncbi:MAG: TatD family hydrolase [Thermodesulfobacteriota bacterium]|nr:TatD family hydrolase [Thermodesulfobacteriota bacterium]